MSINNFTCNIIVKFENLQSTIFKLNFNLSLQFESTLILNLTLDILAYYEIPENVKINTRHEGIYDIATV
jgi:hypothetical protein